MYYFIRVAGHRTYYVSTSMSDQQKDRLLLSLYRNNCAIAQFFYLCLGAVRQSSIGLIFA